MLIAPNAGHTTQNDGWTVQNAAAPCVMLAATHIMFTKDRRWGLRPPLGPQGTPISILEKTLSRNEF